jgi:hypothetical protein
MLAKAILIWIVGLITFVPYGTYYLLYEAPREHYAILITSILFWIFGYWGVAGPLLMMLKVRSVFRAVESAQSRRELERALQSPDAREVAIDLIARENRIPRFLASRVFALLVIRLSQRIG